MKTCDQCKHEFPDGLVVELWCYGAYLHVCGVCALVNIRASHGNPDLEFTPGSKARRIYEASKAVRASKAEAQ